MNDTSLQNDKNNNIKQQNKETNSSWEFNVCIVCLSKMALPYIKLYNIEKIYTKMLFTIVLQFFFVYKFVPIGNIGTMYICTHHIYAKVS